MLAVAYVLHSLVDFDWDFVAVTGPFLLSAGALLGGPAVRDEPRIAFGSVAYVVRVIEMEVSGQIAADDALDACMTSLLGVMTQVGMPTT